MHSTLFIEFETDGIDHSKKWNLVRMCKHVENVRAGKARTQPQ
jgi:hypothetical protein